MLATSEAQAASCRNYGQEIQAAIKGHVVALRKIEHETADRITGLDTRPFEYLLTQARTAADAIGDKFGLDEEAALSRCRNYIAPVRHTCAARPRRSSPWSKRWPAGAATCRRSRTTSRPCRSASVGWV
jgi:hypothetical protein